MNILIIGSGGREHALAWKIAQSPNCSNLYIVPGNAGTAQVATNLPIAVTDFEGIKTACVDHSISMVVVGPEEPLVKGLYEFIKLQDGLQHIRFIGPDSAGAMLEGSKAFAKEFMLKNKIPTAAYREFSKDNFDEGVAYLQSHSLPVVLKADGLAAGKGVLICESNEDAISEFSAMILDAKFGGAGAKVVVEQFLSGIEMSVFVLTDGKDFVLLPEAKDYKRIGKGDTGLNTGGMGAVSPVPFYDAVLKEKVIERIVKPTISGIAEAGMCYKGFVFIGLMIVDKEPYVIEYNCRMGDPETEVVIPRIKTDLVALLDAAATGQLKSMSIACDERTAVGIVAVSGGYPGDFEKGKIINGLEKILPEGQMIFHSGTKSEAANVCTNGGRVLVATSFGFSVEEAASKSRNALTNIEYEGKYFRDDIGYEFI